MLATAAAVAVAVHAVVDGMSWPVASPSGAIVSPTDPLAATAIGRRLGVPRRLLTVIEGESLVNDATALVAYRVAVAAAVSGSFVAWQAGLRFVVGVAAAWPSGCWSAGSSPSCGGGSTTRWSRSSSRWSPATSPSCRPSCSGSPGSWPR